jgi:16S rRNA (uracil1498-N3)-methyltransferase
MRQFILPEDWDGGPSCLIEGGRASYLGRVLRLGPGDSFPARDSSGRAWACVVVEAGPGRLLLRVSPGTEAEPGYLPDIRGGAGHRASAAGSRSDPPALARILLVVGLPKGPKMDLVVRQATEAGIEAVLPLLSSRSLARGEEGGGARRARWDRIVREALQQSGSAITTRVLDPLELAALPSALDRLGLGPSDPRILLHEAPLAQSSMHGYLTETPEAIALCVGPEGGFAPDEVEFLLGAGFKPLRLAGAVLRAETAALYAVAAAQIILSERSSWIPKPP